MVVKNNDLKLELTSVFNSFLLSLDLDKLLNQLNTVDRLMKKEYKSEDSNLWFRFFSNDTAATTIRDIKNDLSLPIKHRNFINLIECIEIAVEDKSLTINFS